MALFKGRLGAQNPSLTEGPIVQGILSFALPLFLGQLLQQLYNLADAWVLGNFADNGAFAAVSSGGSLTFLVIGFFNGIAIGGGVVISRYYGAKDEENVIRAIHTNFLFGVIASVLSTVVGLLLVPRLLLVMNTPESVLPYSLTYFRIYFGGVFTVILYNICMAIMRSLGDSLHPLYYLILSSLINVSLDLLFVGGLRMGVASAAAATVISQGVSALLCLRRLVRTEEVYRVDLRRVRIDWPMLKLIVRFGLPSGVQNSLIGFANVMVQTNINAFGDSAMAGCGSYSKIEGFAFLPVTCFSMGLATFVSQNLGARQHDRVKQGARFGVLCSVVTAEVIGVAIWLGAPFFIALFNNDPEVVAFGVRQARVESLFYCLLALNHCIAGVLRGAGKATVPMVIMMVCWCVIRVVYITAAVGIWRNILVIFTAYPLTWSLSAVAFLIYYFKADWLHTFDRLDARQQG